MRAVTIADGELHWREHSDPQPGKAELLVQVAAAGLNGADLIQRAGRYPAPQGVPRDIPGLELAGVVVETGPGTTRFAVGDRVMAVVAGAGQAELAVVGERAAMGVPEDIDMVSAGGFPEVFTTAHDALFTQCHLAVGERVCIHGAAGGVGTAAVQLAVAAGCSTVATVREPTLRPAIEALGARAVDPADAAEHGPFDAILELVGAPNIPLDLKMLAPLGRISVIGIGAGARAELDLRDLMGARGTIMGSTLRPRSPEDKAAAARAVEKHVLPLLAAGKVRVPVAATFPMRDAAAAYERFAAGRKLGKIVLVVEGA